jgi:hypothetical protein
MTPAFRSRGPVFEKSLMDDARSSPKSADCGWKLRWHLTTVLFPRRSITGRLVRGRVWRRHDGRQWIYKRFVEFDEVSHH